MFHWALTRYWVTKVCEHLSLSASPTEFSSPERTTSERFLYSHHSASSHLLSYSQQRLSINISEFYNSHQSQLKQDMAELMCGKTELQGCHLVAE